MSHRLILPSDYAALRAEHAGQLALTARVLAGETLATVAKDAQVGVKRISAIVHVVCQYRNPDVYCEELKRCLKASIVTWDVKPSLAFLRAHFEEFGFRRRSEELGA